VLSLIHLHVQYAEFYSYVKARRKSMWFIKSYFFFLRPTFFS